MNRRFPSALAGAAVIGALLVSAQAAASTGSAKQPAMTKAMHAQVMLVTGDEVTLTTYPNGRQTAAVLPANRQGPAGQFQTFNRGRDMYVVPQSAVPYLGTTLSLRLFDVSQLALHPASQLKARVTLRASTHQAALPGATVRRTGATSELASFTKTSASRFGRALGQQAMRDHASPTHRTGLFASIARIFPDGTPAPAVTRPSDSTYTLTLNATDWAGNPDNGDSANIYNIDDLNTFSTTVTFSAGTAQVTVPPGHYSVIAEFYNYQDGDIYAMALPQFTVKKNTTQSLDAQDATQQVSVSTPKQATPMVNEVGMGSTDALGNTGTYAFLAGGANTFFAQPTKKAPTVGQFHYYVYQRDFSPSTAKKAYTYDLEFPTDGVIPQNETYTATPGSLATIKSTYGADHTAQSSLDTRFGALAWQSALFGSDVAFTTPTTRTEYYTGRPDLYWQGTDYQVYISNPFTLLGEIDTSWSTYQAGSTRSEGWAVDPTHARLLQTPIYVNYTVCPVCETSTSLEALAFPFGDNSDNHRTYPDSAASGLTETTNWQVDAGKSQLQAGTGLLSADAPLQSGAKSYTLSYDTTRSSSDFLLSTAIDTSWTVKANAPLGALPSGWVCSLNGDTDCGVMPVMTADYSLPTNSIGQLPSGAATGSVTIGHLVGATGVNVKAFTAKVSFDGGKTWTSAQVTDNGSGQYSVAFTVPAKAKTNGYGALQIHATDSYGGAISETIVNAFAVK